MIDGPHTSLTRRDAARLLAGGVASLGLLGGCSATPAVNSASAPVGGAARYSRHARRLVDESNVIDMLVSVRQAMVVKGEENSLEKAAERYLTWFKNPEGITAGDVERYQSSGISTFYGAPDLGSMLPGASPHDRANYFFRSWRTILALHPELFLPVYDGNDLETAPRSGLIGVILGLQNGDHFRTGADVPYFFALGQRVSQLTYNRENHLAGGAFTSVGLKPAGREVVLAMNDIGMVVDLSHSSDATAQGVLDIAKVTPIISHSNCRALNPDFSRAVPDSTIKALATRGGVMGITVLRQFVSPREPTTIDDFIAHIDHIAQIAGVEHVGIGSDNDLTPFDGVDDAARDKFFATSSDPAYKWRKRLGIDGLDHNRRIYDITEQLIRRGYKDEQIKLVLGGNWLRVLKKIWTTHA